MQQRDPNNVPVTINEKTDYPFDGAINLTVTTAQPVHFPLYVRIPGWADEATVSVNGKPVTDKLTPGNVLQTRSHLSIRAMS